MHIFIFIISNLIGSFLISWLFNNGYKHVEDKKHAESKTFTTLISDLGQFYNIEVYHYKNKTNVKKTSFFDSFKIIPFSVKDIAKSFGIKEQKLEIDYMQEREKGHILTDDEINYIRNDVIIMSKALYQVFSEDLKKMTSARKCNFRL